VEFLYWLENTDAVTWIRESTSLLGYTLYLSLHTLGLVFLLGPVLVMGLRIVGLVPRLPVAPLRAFFPLMAGGFVVNVVSGLVLFATAPVGFVRNTTFLVKLACVLLAVAVLRAFVRRVFGGPDHPDVAIETPRARVLFAVSAAFWTLAIAAGRLTAYSAYVISETVGALVALFLFAAVATLVARTVVARRAIREQVPAGLVMPLKGD
jgi:hypothetical protein